MLFDFAWIFQPGGTNTLVGGAGNPTSVPFSQIANQPPGSKISLNQLGAPTGTQIVINDVGFYQVSWGVQNNTNITNLKFTLLVNGVAQADQQVTQTMAGGNRTMAGLTNIIALTNPGGSTLLLRNDGTNATLNTTDTSTSGVCAYMTIVKLQ